LAKKDDENAESSSDDDKSVSRFRKAVKGVRKKKEDVIGKKLESLESIQACKDAALTGDDEIRLLAVCRLGEFGSAAIDALDISLLDDNPMVRVIAAGMLAYSEDFEAIENQTKVEEGTELVFWSVYACVTFTEVENFEITWRGDIYRDAPQASDALAFGAKGITYRATKGK